MATIFSYQRLEAALQVSTTCVKHAFIQVGVPHYSNVTLYNTDASTTVVTHECKAETTSGAKGSETEMEDEIDFQVYASDDDGICIKVKYEQEIEDEAADMEQETEASFKVCFQQLIEYSKQEGSSEEAYGWSEGDTIHQTFDLTDWADFGEVLTDSSDGMSTFDVTSNDGLITMTFTIMPAGDDERITANSIKADVRIVDFPWTQSNSYVALLSDVESELEVDIDQEEDDELDTVVDAGQEEPIDEQPEPTDEEQAPTGRSIANYR